MKPDHLDPLENTDHEAKDDSMNRDAWLKELYDANYDRLYRIAAHRLRMHVGHISDVQDVLQDVFLEAAQEKIINHPNPEGWLISATKNICNNYIKGDRRRRRKQYKCEQALAAEYPRHAYGMIASTEDELTASDARMTLQQLLPEDEYRLMQQYCVEKRPISEIAESMEISENALRVRIHRIRKKLGKFFP